MTFVKTSFFHELHGIELAATHAEYDLYFFSLKGGKIFGKIETIGNFSNFLDLFTIINRKIVPIGKPLHLRPHKVTIDIDTIINRKSFDWFPFLIKKPNLGIAGGIGIDIEYQPVSLEYERFCDKITICMIGCVC